MNNRFPRSRWVTPVVAITLFVVIAAIQFIAMNSMSMYGILPGITYMGSNPSMLDLNFEPLVPVTGANMRNVLIADSFTIRNNDWSSLSGQAWEEQERLKISPPLLDVPAFAEWTTTRDSLPETFIYSADVWSLSDFEQRQGLALNLGTDSPLVFLIKAGEQEYAIGTWVNQKMNSLVDWQISDCIQSGQLGNHLEIGCNGNQVSMSINACDVAAVTIDTSCNIGAAGAVVLNPGWVMHLDNAIIRLTD